MLFLRRDVGLEGIERGRDGGDFTVEEGGVRGGVEEAGEGEGVGEEVGGEEGGDAGDVFLEGVVRGAGLEEREGGGREGRGEFEGEENYELQQVWRERRCLLGEWEGTQC